MFKIVEKIFIFFLLPWSFKFLPTHSNPRTNSFTRESYVVAQLCLKTNRAVTHLGFHWFKNFHCHFWNPCEFLYTFSTSMIPIDSNNFSFKKSAEWEKIYKYFKMILINCTDTSKIDIYASVCKYSLTHSMHVKMLFKKLVLV